MKLLKQAQAVILSITIAIAPPIAYATAPTKWTAQNVKVFGQTVNIEAIKGNLKSAITTTASKQAVNRLIKGGLGQVAVSYAIDGLLGATDWVLDPANNAIRYKVSDEGFEYRIDGKAFDSVEQACKYVWSDDFLEKRGYKQTRMNTYDERRGKYYQSIQWYGAFAFDCHVNVGDRNTQYDGNIGGGVTYWRGYKWGKGVIDERSVSLDKVTDEIINNAKRGHTQSQQAIEQAIKEAVKLGEYDQLLQDKAVPINGEDGQDGIDGTNGQDGADAPKLDTSSLVNAISSLADRLSHAFGRLETKADSIVQEQQDIKRVINTSIDSIIDVERETQKRITSIETAVGTQGQLINDNIDKAIDTIKIQTDVINTHLDAITEAIRAKEHGLSDEVINDSIDKAIQNAKENTTSQNDILKQQIDKLIAENAKNADKITEAVKEKTKDDHQSQAQPKPQELPLFCGWATVVCEFIDWFKRDPELPQTPDYKPPIQQRDDLAKADINKQHYNVVAQCPAPTVIALPYGQIAIPYTNVCLFFEKISSLIVAVAYIMGAFIVIGRT